MPADMAAARLRAAGWSPGRIKRLLLAAYPHLQDGQAMALALPREQACFTAYGINQCFVPFAKFTKLQLAQNRERMLHPKAT